MPQTAEGHAVMAAIGRFGVWKRAGMEGAICGLDLAEALQSVPDHLDRPFVVRLFAVAETFFIRAFNARTAESTGPSDGR